MDRDDIQQYRYKPHAPAHDYLATCLQLGDLWLSSCSKVFFTEQMLASLRSNNFPAKYVNVSGHVPDGITRLQNGLKSIAVGYEVDLNLKESERYWDTIKYYEELRDVAVVIWLVRNDWIAERISKIISERTQCRITGFIFSEDGNKLATYRCIQHHYEYAFKAAQVDFRSTHILRHSFATHFLEATLNHNALKAMLGHTTVKMTEKYGKPTDRMMLNGMEDFETKLRQAQPEKA